MLDFLERTGLHHIDYLNYPTGAIVVTLFTGREVNFSICNRVYRIVTAHADTTAGPVFTAALAYDNVAWNGSLTV